MRKIAFRQAFWDGFKRGILLGPIWRWLDRTINGDVVVTCDNGRAIAVTRQDKDGRMLEIIWFEDGAVSVGNSEVREQ